MFIIFYITNAPRNIFFASGIMPMLIYFKDLFWAATGRVSAVSLSVLHHLKLWKGALVLGVICCPFGMIDQNKGVKSKTSESDWK